MRLMSSHRGCLQAAVRGRGREGEGGRERGYEEHCAGLG